MRANPVSSGQRLVLLEALTGQPGFDGTPNQMLLARLSGPPTLPDVPHPWAELLAAMLARDPQVRPKPKAILDTLNGAEATRPLVDVTAAKSSRWSSITASTSGRCPRSRRAAPRAHVLFP